MREIKAMGLGGLALCWAVAGWAATPTPQEVECLFEQVQNRYLGQANPPVAYLADPVHAYKVYGGVGVGGVNLHNGHLVFLATGQALQDFGPAAQWLASLGCPPRPSAYPTKTLNMLVAHFYFPETGAGATPFSVATSRAMFETDTRSIKAFFDEASYGQVQLALTYADPMALAQSKAQYQQEDALGNTLVASARDSLDRVMPLKNYDVVYLSLPPLNNGAPGCAAYKGKTTVLVNGQPVTQQFAWGAGNDFACYHKDIIAHEIMHTFGAGHTSSLNCDDSISRVIGVDDPLRCATASQGMYFVTGDRFDVMGSYTGQPNVYWKWQAGWLDASQIFTADDTAMAALDPVDARSFGLKGVKIPAGSSPTTGAVTYWVEYRTQPVSRMQNTPTPLRTEHIQIRLHVPQLIDQFQQTQDDVMLSMWANYKPTMILNAPGEQFEDPQRKIRITWKGMTTSVSPAQALIHVEKLP